MFQTLLHNRIDRWRCIAFAIAVLPAALCKSDDPTDSVIKFPVKTKDFVVTVTDQSGKPVEGARVYGHILRPIQSPGSVHPWPENNIGPPPIVQTDRSGRASFPYPPTYGRPSNWYQTKIVSYKVHHPEYIKEHFETPAQDSPATVALVPGCELVVSAVDTNRLRITNLGVLVGGNQVQFVPGENPGEIRSRSIPRGTRQVMLVSPNKKTGGHLFSKVRNLSFGESRRVSLKGLMLRPGVEVSGQVSENVPRPIKNGCVIAFSTPMPSTTEKKSTVRWIDGVPIDADGSFSFPSLPSTGTLQLIAICDGWVIDGKRPGLALKGITYDLETTRYENNQLAITIPMAAMTSAKFVIRSLDGTPIEGVQVTVAPNQHLENYGAQVLGRVSKTTDYLNKPIPYRRKKHTIDKSKERWVRSTDKNGTAFFPDLPIGSHIVTTHHEQYRIPEDDGQIQFAPGMLQLWFNDPKENLIELNLEPIPQKPE